MPDCVLGSALIKAKLRLICLKSQLIRIRAMTAIKINFIMSSFFQVTPFYFLSHYFKPQFREIILKPGTQCVGSTRSDVMFKTQSYELLKTFETVKKWFVEKTDYSSLAHS